MVDIDWQNKAFIKGPYAPLVSAPSHIITDHVRSYIDELSEINWCLGRRAVLKEIAHISAGLTAWALRELEKIDGSEDAE